jgi:hypothetical protein
MTEKYGITLDLSRDALFDQLGIKRLKESTPFQAEFRGN